MKKLYFGIQTTRENSLLQKINDKYVQKGVPQRQFDSESYASGASNQAVLGKYRAQSESESMNVRDSMRVGHQEIQPGASLTINTFTNSRRMHRSPPRQFYLEDDDQSVNQLLLQGEQKERLRQKRHARRSDKEGPLSRMGKEALDEIGRQQLYPSPKSSQQQQNINVFQQAPPQLPQQPAIVQQPRNQAAEQRKLKKMLDDTDGLQRGRILNQYAQKHGLSEDQIQLFKQQARSKKNLSSHIGEADSYENVIQNLAKNIKKNALKQEQRAQDSTAVLEQISQLSQLQKQEIIDDKIKTADFTTNQRSLYDNLVKQDSAIVENWQGSFENTIDYIAKNVSQLSGSVDSQEKDVQILKESTPQQFVKSIVIKTKKEPSELFEFNSKQGYRSKRMV